MTYPDPPTPQPVYKLVTELYAREIREHAGAVDLPSEVACDYQAACYLAAAYLERAGAIARPYAKITSPPTHSPRLFSDFIFPMMAGVGITLLFFLVFGNA